MSDREQLEAAIAKSGLGVGEFSRRLLVRDERLVRRYLDGSKSVPVEVVRWCRSYLAGEVTVTWSTSDP